MTSNITDRIYGESASVAVKAPCVAVALAPLPLSGLGAVGSYAPNVNDRILVAAQADPSTNGIYNASNGTWKRSGDFDGIYDAVQGTLIAVISPNSGGSIFYQLTTFNPIIGTTPLVFASFINPTIVYGITQAEFFSGIVPVAPNFPEGDIRRYGANTLAADNSAAINTATLVSSNGGNAAFVPVGTWRHTTTVSMPGSSSIYGLGTLSVLAPNGCDGLTFTTPSLYSGSRFVKDLSLNGVIAVNNNGIVVNFTAASGIKVVGVKFSNITIQNFGVPVLVRGLWLSSFQDCFLYNNYQGYHFHGQNVGVSITGGICQVGSLAGAGTQIGLNIDSIDGEQSQAIFVGDNADFYGHAIGASIGPALDVSITNSSFNFVTQEGISIFAVIGGLNITGNFIQTNNAAVGTIGIDLSDLGSSLVDKAVIEGNHLECNAANGGSIAIYVGTNHQSVTVCDNTIGQATTAWGTGIEVSNAQNASITKNTIYASSTAIQISAFAGNCEVGPNTIQNGTPLVLAGGTPSGLMYQAPGMRGAAVFPAATSVAVNFAQPMPDASYSVSLGGNAAGFVWPVSKSANGFIINCNASNSNATDWAVTYR